MKKLVLSLSLLATIETAAIIYLLARNVRVVVNQTPVAIENPLRLAIRYDSSDRKFAELVERNPEFIFYRPPQRGLRYSPILADCALLGRTNFARILIKHGADVEESIKSLKETASQHAIDLLLEIKAEIDAEQSKTDQSK